MSLEKDVERIIRELEEREKRQDGLLVLTRSLIRSCSRCIKLIHGAEFKKAEKERKEADASLARINKMGDGFGGLVMQSYQEYAEMRMMLNLIGGKEVPGCKELGVPPVAYLNGLCDCVGELRREMLVQLRKGKKKKAEAHFRSMESIYDALLPIRFSNSLLPGFRRKQDVARVQIEQARSELLKA